MMVPFVFDGLSDGNDAMVQLLLMDYLSETNNECIDYLHINNG